MKDVRVAVLGCTKVHLEECPVSKEAKRMPRKDCKDRPSTWFLSTATTVGSRTS